MKNKKIRGQKRRWKAIEKWRRDCLSVDLKDYLLKGNPDYHAKIRVHPWSGISVTNSVIPEPKGKTKREMLRALLDIYDGWKQQLDELGQPYYLRIWLFEPRFSESQVVCAFGDSLGFYKHTFFKPENSKSLPIDHYGGLKERLRLFSWDYHLDEYHFGNMEFGKPEDYASMEDYLESKRWYLKEFKKTAPHGKTKDIRG